MPPGKGLYTHLLLHDALDLPTSKYGGAAFQSPCYTLYHTVPSENSSTFPLYGKQLKSRDDIHFHLQIHHGDKHQATYSKCSIFAELISYIYSKIFSFCKIYYLVLLGIRFEVLFKRTNKRTVFIW